jgi:cytochrome P450
VRRSARLDVRAGESQLLKFRPFEGDFLEDPYPTLARLRQESPVARVGVRPLTALAMVRRFAKMRRAAGEPGLLRTAVRGWRDRKREGGGDRPWERGWPRFLAVSRYEDVSHVLRHPEIFSSKAMGGMEDPEAEQFHPTQGSLIGIDPPEHTHHRGIVSRGFTPRRIADLGPRVRKLADELISAFEPRRRCDLVDEYSNPIPVAMIAELLGLPAEHRADFKRWSGALIVGSTQIGSAVNTRLFVEFREYMSKVVERRRREPGDDLVSLLVHAEEENGILDTTQVVGFASLMLAAGSETTTNAIGNALLALQANPDQRALVHEDPGRIPALVEETLRFDPPVQMLMRLALEDTEIRGVPIPKGAMVLPLIAAANRDPEQFEAPERFDIERDTQGHLGFGLGNHFCLGASLARLEACVALEMVFERMPDWRIEMQDVARHGSWLIRGPTELPIRF